MQDMHENLSEMIQDTNTGSPDKGVELDIEQATVNIEKEVDEELGFDITTIPLATWFAANSQLFQNIRPVGVQVRDVPENKYIIFAVDNHKRDLNEEGRVIKSLRLFPDANIFPVINLPGVSMNVFKNGFITIHDHGNGRYLKCYGVKTGLVTFYCVSIDGELVPYSKTKIKKTDAGLDMVEPDNDQIVANLNAALDSEALQIQYSQIQKVISDITTKSEAIKWMSAKTQDVADINHLMQIDDVLMWLIS
jgi:hypothetical protein